MSICMNMHIFQTIWKSWKLFLTNHADESFKNQNTFVYFEDILKGELWIMFCLFSLQL